MYKKYVQSEFDAMYCDENGVRHCPSGNYSLIAAIPSWCSFSEQCIFSDNSTFGEGCTFGQNCIFGMRSTFSQECSFDSFCSFGNHCLFKEGCHFGIKCTFGMVCKFGRYTRFENWCRFGKGCHFEDIAILVKNQKASSHPKQPKTKPETPILPHVGDYVTINEKYASTAPWSIWVVTAAPWVDSFGIAWVELGGKFNYPCDGLDKYEVVY